MPKLSFLSHHTHTHTHTNTQFGKIKKKSCITYIGLLYIRHIRVLIIYLSLIAKHTHCIDSKCIFGYTQDLLCTCILGYTQDLLCTCFQPISSHYLSLPRTMIRSLSLSQPESHIRLYSLASLTAELFDAERDECISKVILHSAAWGDFGHPNLIVFTPAEGQL